MLDSSFWDSVLGTATTHLGNLFEDIGFGASPQSAPQPEPNYGMGNNPFMQAFDPPQEWGWLSPKEDASPWGFLKAPAATRANGQPNPFAPTKAPVAAAAGGTVAGPFYGGQFQYETPLDLAQDPQTQQYVQMARAAAKAMGIDEEVFVRQINAESTFRNDKTSKAGAQGLGQLMPATARELGVTNPWDAESNLNASARYLKQQLDRYKGDYTKALAAYNMGAGNLDANGGVPAGEGAVYVNRIMAGAKRKEAQQANGGAPGAPQGDKPLKGLTVAQYGPEGLATGAADYICGPIAAAAFVAASGGKQPNLEESLNMARRMGVIDAGTGMHGIESTASLIRSLGAKATAGAVNEREIVGEIMAGRPVIVDTNAGSRGHYFFIEDYDPATGKFDFGNSAKALRASGGNSWYTLAEISSLGFGDVHGAIYAR